MVPNRNIQHLSIAAESSLWLKQLQRQNFGGFGSAQTELLPAHIMKLVGRKVAPQKRFDHK